MVIPPKASQNASLDVNVLNSLCYQYKYDYRNRLSEKKIPGKGWELIIYDNLDRPILTQDAIQKSKDHWLITRYDKLGRVAYTGVYNNNFTKVQAQAWAKSLDFVEGEMYVMNLDEEQKFYADQNLLLDVKVLTVIYYDDYDFHQVGSVNLDLVGSSIVTD